VNSMVSFNRLMRRRITRLANAAKAAADAAAAAGSITNPDAVPESLLLRTLWLLLRLVLLVALCPSDNEMNTKRRVIRVAEAFLRILLWDKYLREAVGLLGFIGIDLMVRVGISDDSIIGGV
jgi:hypothetical protein